MMKRQISAGLMFTALFAAPALAEGPGGTVEVTLGGVPFGCKISPTQSDFSCFGPVTSLNISTWRCKGIEGPDTLSLGFELAFDRIDRLEIRLRGAGLALYGESGEIITDLSTREQSGTLTLAGRLTGAVAPSSDHGRTTQAGQAQALEIGFSAVIVALGQ